MTNIVLYKTQYNSDSMEGKGYMVVSGWYDNELDAYAGVLRHSADMGGGKGEIVKLAFTDHPNELKLKLKETVVWGYFNGKYNQWNPQTKSPKYMDRESYDLALENHPRY